MSLLLLLNYSGSPYYLKLTRDFQKAGRTFKFGYPPINGWYDNFSGHLICFFREDSNLYFKADSNVYELDDTTSSSWECPEDKAKFKLMVNGEVVFTLEYKSKATKGLNKYDINYQEAQDDILFAINEAISHPESWGERFN